MQSLENLQQMKTLHVKNEVITIDEDEIQTCGSDKILEDPQNNGPEPQQNSIYYYEPQQKSNFIVKMEDKSKFVNLFILL